MLLPLAISFFTFQQIAYLVDCRSGRRTPPSLVDYALFVSFFPQLIAGPIVHTSDVLRHFGRVGRHLRAEHVAAALAMFTLALAASAPPTWLAREAIWTSLGSCRGPSRRSHPQ